MTVGLERHSGYLDGLAGAGLPRDDALVEPGDFSLESGTLAARRLLERAPDLDGLFAASDAMAIGAMRALRAAGRTVPQDVAVIGFEDSPAAPHTDPPLTTVHQPVEAMGREMVRLLRLRIGGGTLPEPLVILPTHLVIRGSA
jgi:DNA-binding LacI/PurR family transcriptional regulator